MSDNLRQSEVSVEVKDIRRENMRELIAREGSLKAFCALIDRDPGQITQVTSLNYARNIGANLARDVEKKLNLPNGWMDQPHKDEIEGVDFAVVKKIMVAVDKQLAQEKIQLSPEKKADIVEALYPMFSNDSPIDAGSIRRILAVLA